MPNTKPTSLQSFVCVEWILYKYAQCGYQVKHRVKYNAEWKIFVKRNDMFIFQEIKLSSYSFSKNIQNFSVN